MIQSINKQNWLSLIRKSSGLMILLLLGITMSFASEYFLTGRNLMNIALQSSILAIVAIGVAMTMITGGIDLSVGSVAAFSGALSAGLLVQHGFELPTAIILALAAGFIFGMVNGALIVYGKLPPFIATLATMAIARGATLLYTQGRPITVLDMDFVFLGNGTIGSIPMPVLIMLVVLFGSFLFLGYTKTGRNIYAIGGNEKASFLAGINTKFGKMLVYIISSSFAALGGVLLTARLWSAQPTTGTGLELEAIAAAVLGGTSLFGGVGGAFGTVIGVLIVGILSNGLNLLEISSYYQQVIKGIVLVLAVILDMYAKRSRKQ